VFDPPHGSFRGLLADLGGLRIGRLAPRVMRVRARASPCEPVRNRLVRRHPQHRTVPSRDRPLDESARRAVWLSQRIGREIREARRMAGISQDRLGAAAGLSGSEVGRVERGEAPSLTIGASVRLLRVVGLDLWLKTYPFGPPLRDAAHTALMDRLIGRLPGTVAWRREWPLPVPGDHRAVDLVLIGLPVTTGIEVETRLIDEQALLRDIHSKQRDAGLERMYLLLLRSRSNTAALRGAIGLTRSFPLSTRTVLAALRNARDPGANGIIVL
jgi:transcriptional regulator with XRE-family HTH domain